MLAASGPSERGRIEEAARGIERRGYRVTITANVDHRHRGYLAGSDEERAAVVNAALRSPEYDAYFFSRGGYGAMRILEAIDYDAIRANPRPIVGFSDVTALHQAVAVRAGVAGFHGPMLNLDFHQGLPPDIEQWLWDMLGGEGPMVHRFDPSQVIAEGEAEGILFGGCLALTGALVGTPFDYWPEGGIWFWEDVEEPVYRIDRMLTHLRLSGRMPRIRGVVIGRLKGCGEENELSSLLAEFFGSSGIPVIRNVPFGHHGDNLLLPVGVPARLSTTGNTLTITTPAVRRA